MNLLVMNCRASLTYAGLIAALLLNSSAGFARDRAFPENGVYVSKSVLWSKKGSHTKRPVVVRLDVTETEDDPNAICGPGRYPTQVHVTLDDGTQSPYHTDALPVFGSLLYLSQNKEDSRHSGYYRAYQMNDFSGRCAPTEWLLGMNGNQIEIIDTGSPNSSADITPFEFPLMDLATWNSRFPLMRFEQKITGPFTRIE